MAETSIWRRSAWLLLLATASCGDSDEPVANAPGQVAQQGRACDILSSGDAEKALGRPVQQMPNDGGPGGLDICQYGYQGERIADAGNVSVTLQPVDIASLRKGVVDAGGTPEPVAGLGDAAFWTPDYGLYVGKGNKTAIYLLAAGGMTDAKARSIELARATSGKF
jgi:hypothetical protein